VIRGRATARSGAPGPGTDAVPAAPDPAARLLRLCLPATAAALALCVLAGAASGWAAACSAAIGGLLAAGPLAAGLILMQRSARWQPLAVMAAAISTYAAVVLLLGLAWVVLDAVGWLSTGHLAAAAVISTLAWVLAQAVGSARLRVLAFGSPPGETIAGKDMNAADHTR